MMSEENLPKELTSNIARRGKWTVEEERYTEQIIEDFDQGVLDVPEGTTLRTYLSRVLNCDPMRITKKYTGNLCIGKRTFVPKPTISESDYQYLGLCYSRLIDLRQCWINKLLLTEQWNNRKLNQFRGTKTPMDEPLSNMVPPAGFNPVSLFTYGNLSSASGMMSETGASVSPPNEEANTTSSSVSAVTATSVEEEADQLCFSEFRVFNALRPFVKEIVETELIIDWLKLCAGVLNASASSAMPETVVLDQVTSSCRLSMASLYKVLLSGCVAEFKPLHSCVQAVFERLILSNDVPRNAATPAVVSSTSVAASMMPVVLSSTDLQKLETVSNDDQDTASEGSIDTIESNKRMKFEHSVTPTLGTPTHASGDDSISGAVSVDATAAPLSAAPVTPTAVHGDGAKLTLEQCVNALKHKRSLQMMQGPITATAVQYREQQQRALTCSRSAPLAVPSGPFLNAYDPQALSQRLTSSLNQSMIKISRNVLEQSSSQSSVLNPPNHMMYVTPSNIETAAEALLGLISN